MKTVFIFESGNLINIEGEVNEKIKGFFNAIKEAIDFSGLPVNQYRLAFDEKNFVIEDLNGERLLVIFADKDENIEEIRKSIIEEKIKPQIEKIEKKEEVKVVGEDIWDKAFEITIKHLSAFGETIFENVLNEMRVDKKNINEKKFIQFVRNLGQSARMIIGPSKAEEMIREILELLK